MRKVFTDNLPTKSYNKKECIDWDKSKGNSVKFIYDNIEGIIFIKNVYKDKDYIMLTIIYNNICADINKMNFVKGNIGKILNVRNKDFKVEIGTVFKDDKRDLTIIDREFRIDNSDIKRKYYNTTVTKMIMKVGWKKAIY